MLPNTLDFKLGLMVGAGSCALGLFVGWCLARLICAICDTLGVV